MRQDLSEGVPAHNRLIAWLLVALLWYIMVIVIRRTCKYGTKEGYNYIYKKGKDLSVPRHERAVVEDEFHFELHWPLCSDLSIICLKRHI